MTQATSPDVQPVATATQDGDEISLLDVLAILATRWRLLVFTPIAAGALALGGTYLIAPTFTAKTTFLPPQQQQSTAASALASLGALSGLAGGMASIKSPSDQYVSLMQSVNAQDRIVDQFKLMEVYETKYRFEARKALTQNVRISLGKKDGLITVEADDTDPQRAADLANAHVTELRRLSADLALTEAQQRRVFFEAELQKTRIKLTQAQQILQSSGFSASTLRAEPKAAAEGYAALKAEATAAEVKLQTLRRALADNTPEVQQQVTLLGALRAQLSKLESSSDTKNDADYISRYREFKYQEALFDLFAKQYEMARLDESREGALIQVVDVATKPEWKSKPKRGFIALAIAFGTVLLLGASLLISDSWKHARRQAA